VVSELGGRAGGGGKGEIPTVPPIEDYANEPT